MATLPAGGKPPPRTKKPADAKIKGVVGARASKTAAPKASKKPDDSQQGELTPKQQRFVEEYLIDLNGTQAAIRAGYSKATAQEQSSRLLSNVKVQDAVVKLRQEQQERTGISADRVVQEAWKIVTADPRDLIEVKIDCCRHCHGIGHGYQRNMSEMNADREKWLNKGKPIEEFDEQGGVGFNPLLAPNPECPNCGGDGMQRVVAKDTRYLSAGAASLYAGAKQTKDGFEIKLHDKSAFAEKLFKHLGLYEADNRQKSPLEALNSLATAELLRLKESLLKGSP
jgi:phage terminase small subunit